MKQKNNRDRQHKHLPAAKCSGVDFLPAVSRALTVCDVMSFLTLTRSPVLHASNRSRRGSLAIAAASRFTESIERLLLLLPLLTPPLDDWIVVRWCPVAEEDISHRPISDGSSFAALVPEPGLHAHRELGVFDGSKKNHNVLRF